jgi:hypothetical protein
MGHWKSLRCVNQRQVIFFDLSFCYQFIGPLINFVSTHTNRERNEQFTVIDDIPKEILLNLVKCVLDAAKDNDKVRYRNFFSISSFQKFLSNK